MNTQIKYAFPFKLSIDWQNKVPRLKLSTKASKDAFFQIVLIIVVVLGIFFRLGNLSLKPYWEDEVYTSTLLSGYEIEIIKAELKDQLVSVESLSKYQDVRLGQGWKDVAFALAKRPEHTPLYFILARVWALCFGSTVTAMRAFPAIASLFTLPLFYWLARLLFNSKETAAVTLCLACTSPILIRYAQDARPYSLWVVGMLLSSVMLLRALQHNQQRHWVLYSLSVAFSGLTHWLSGFVFLAHGFHVLASRNFSKPSEKVRRKRFLAAVSVGLLPLLPWLGLVIYGRYSVQAVLVWLEQEETVGRLVVKWLENVSHLIFAELPQGKSVLLLAGLLMLAIAGATLQMVKEKKVRQWLLPVLLCLIPTVAFVIPDLLLGGGRSLISRYFLPADIGALLILGFGLSHHQTSSKLAAKRSAQGKRILFYAVLTLSISACWFNFTASNWWGEANASREAATTVIQTSSIAEVYSDQRLSPFMAFSLALRSTDRVMWLDSESLLPAEIFDASRTAFLLEPSDALLARARQASATYGLQVVPTERKSKAPGTSHSLFQITK